MGLAKKFVQVFVTSYRRTQMNFLANPIIVECYKVIKLNYIKLLNSSFNAALSTHEFGIISI